MGADGDGWETMGVMTDGFEKKEFETTEEVKKRLPNQ